MAGYFDSIDPTTAFLLAAGSGLMGTRGPAGFGRAGLMGLEAQQGAKRMQLAEAEERRRAEDSEAMREMRELQMKQIQAALNEQERIRGIYGEIANRVKGQRSAAQSAIAPVALGPVNTAPEADVANILRNANIANERAQMARTASGSGPNGFPFNYDEVLGWKLASRGAVDLTGDYKDAMKTEEVKPGTYQRNIRGGMEFIPAFDLERGVMGDPTNGVRPIPGATAAAASRAGAVKGAEAAATAEYDRVKVLDKRPGSLTFGQIIEVPATQWRAQFGPVMPQEAPAGVPAPSAGTTPPAAPVAAPTARTATPPQQAVPGQRKRILEDELASEQAKLQELQTSSPANIRLKYRSEPQAELERTQANIAGLRREIAALSGAEAPTAGGGLVSPEQAERDAAAAKARQRVNQANVTTDTVSKTIDDALSLVGITSTGAIGGVARMAPWPTDAGALDNAIKTVQANLSFGALQQMRESSPTGGALGQVAIQELEMLKSTVTALDVVRDGPERTQQKLRAIKQHYEKWLDMTQRAYQQQYGRPMPPINLEEDRQVPGGIRYLGTRG